MDGTDGLGWDEVRWGGLGWFVLKALNLGGM